MPDDHSASPPDEESTRSDSPPGGEAPRSIDHYTLRQKLGEGGMGEIWLAEQTDPVRRCVAIKIIKRGMDSKQVVARFEAERQALAIMDHPNIAKVHDAGETPGGRPYFVLEYVKGEPITAYCDRQRLNTRQRLELLMQVCDGVQHAHHKAVIHRDIKPSNVLVTVTDGRPVPKIIDFGVAKAIEHRLTEKTLFTEIGVLLGTPEYMSPEQAEMGATDIDTRTDVYSLGVMLYQLLTGALPFDSKQLRAAAYDEIRRRIREEEPSKPSSRVTTLGGESTAAARKRNTEPRSLARELRGDLDWITMRALDKDRTRRYESPAALSDDLRRHLENQPVMAGPPSVAYRAGRFVRRHRIGVAATAAVVLVLLGFAVAMTVQARRIAAERDRADRERESAERVAEFLSEMLGSVEPEALGTSLWRNLRSHVENVRRDRGATDDGVEAALASFDEVFAGVNPTNPAAQLLDEEILARAGRTIEERLGEQPRIAARLKATLGTIYRELGLYDQAEPYYRAALKDRRRHLGDDDAETLTAIRDLGNVLAAQDKLDEAEPYCREALDRSRQVLGDDHPETLRAIGSMGDLREAQGNYDEAESLYREALDGLRRVSGDDDPATLSWINATGALLQNQGKFDEAERYFREALEGRRRVLGNDDPATLASINQLGGVLAKLGKYDEAETLHREALEGKRRVLGDDHPSTAGSISNLGDLFQWMGKFEEAEAQYREALDAQKRMLGNDHVATLRTMSSLGAALEQQGKLDEAGRLHREALEGFRRALGEDHPYTFSAMHNLAALLHAQGKLDQAEPLYRQVLEKRKRVLGNDHLNTLISINNLGGLLLDRGELDEAALYWREALEITRGKLGDDHPQTLIAMNNLGALLRRAGNLEEAEDLYRQALEGRRRVLGEDNVDTLTTLRGMCFLVWSRGRIDEARSFCREALDGFRKVLGEDHWYTVDSLYRLGCLAAVDGDRDEALEYLSQAEKLGWAKDEIRTTEDLASLRGDPEFEAIVAAVEERLVSSD